MMYLSVIGGFVLLMLCGDLLVRGAVALAMRFGISPLVIALTVVSLGTSAPELMISVNAALKGSPGIALGNIVGSNIANILLVLGLPALIHPISCRGRTLKLNTWFMLAASGLLIALCFLGPITRGEGFLLISLLVAYLAWSAWDARRDRRNEAARRTAEVKAMIRDVKETEKLVEETVESVLNEDLPTAAMSWLIISTLIIAGCGGLPFGAHLVVDGGTQIAQAFHLPEAVIGLSLIAFGTSLPELATSLMSAWRHQRDIAIGNAIGSNIINILAILGTTALITPLPVEPNFLHVDLWVMLLAALAMVPPVMAQGRITRWKGVVFILGYAIFIFTLFQSGSGLT